MKKYAVMFVALFLLCSCAAGPVYMAKNESESIKTMYSDPKAQALYNKNTDLFKDIYLRYNSSRINFYNEGIGITTLKDEKNVPHQYLMTFIRPPEISFDGNTTKGEQRFSYALLEVPRYMKLLKAGDLERDGIEGLAFGIYWPVRDFGQCTSNGGFIEYLYVYFDKNDALDIIAGKKDYK
ncbi:MAG TPA: hypothetical protein VHO84_10775, partial [Syntrophorhabdaceae bacterium]|nr:hypothetical protein [Syntrophorhabdaceae bacterium]